MRTGSLAVLIGLCSLALFASSASAATCAPNAQSFPDSGTDSPAGLAPEATAMTVSVDANCQLTVGYSVTNRPAGPLSGDFWGWYIDSDNNPATGSTGGFTGANYAIGYLSGGAALSQWTGTQFATVGPLTPAGIGATVPLAAIGVTPPATITIAGGSSWTGTQSYNDWVPEIGAGPFAFTIGAGSAPAAPTPTPTPPTTTTTPAVSCRVPTLKGLKLGAAKGRLLAAHCRPGHVRKTRSRSYIGKVIRSSPGSGSQLAEGASVDLVVGSRK